MLNSELTGFSSEDQMLKKIRRNCVDLAVCDVIGGVVFTNMPADSNALPKQVKYKLRIISDYELSRTFTVTPPNDFSSPRSFEKGGKVQRCAGAK